MLPNLATSLATLAATIALAAISPVTIATQWSQPQKSWGSAVTGKAVFSSKSIGITAHHSAVDSSTQNRFSPPDKETRRNIFRLCDSLRCHRTRESDTHRLSACISDDRVRSRNRNRVDFMRRISVGIFVCRQRLSNTCRRNRHPANNETDQQNLDD